MRNFAIHLAVWAVCYLILEIVLRFYFFNISADFLRPDKGLLRKYYPELVTVLSEEVPADTNTRTILILGGSVVSPGYSRLEKRLDTLLTPYLNQGSQLKVYNLAVPAHTSLDNVRKLELLPDKHFDLILYYEAINESRFNNVPPQLFRDDYDHVKWHHDISLILSHKELPFLIAPYAVHYSIRQLQDRLQGKTYIDFEQIKPENMTYGNHIKTAGPYNANINKLVKIANARHEKLLLISYASYFPENVRLTGGESDMAHFGGCQFASPVSVWGKPENVRKCIVENNRELLQVARQTNTPLLDMANLVPQKKSYFCDVCHFSEEGARFFADQLAKNILERKLLDK